MIKRIAMVFVGLLLTAGAVVGADYMGWLGVHKSTYVDYFHVNFKMADGQSGELIEDVFVNCTKQGSRNACSIEQGMNKKSRRVRFGLITNFDKTRFFVRNEQAIGLEDMDIYLTFIHQDYEKKTLGYTLGELLSQEGQTITVTLEKSIL